MKANSPPPIRLWILEDHAQFAKQITRLINAESDMTCERAFSHPDELYREINHGTGLPDLLLLDLGLPGRDGLQILTEIRAKFANQKIIILTAFDDRERVYTAICNGASGYLLKTADPDEILQGIRDVINGAAPLSGAIAKMILEGFSKLGPVEQTEPLTEREEQVLRALVKGHIKKEIAQDLGISLHTVDMHLRAVYRKLHVSTQTEAVSKALRQGLV